MPTKRGVFGYTLDGRKATIRLQVRYEPMGLVAAFTAWNFPARLPARKIAAALAAGCTIVIKPSEETLSSCHHIVEATREAGIPAGILNLITGAPSFISSHLIASPVIRKVSVTGSVPVGKLLFRQCTNTLKKMSLELGGHAPILFFLT
jgi:succinate-semialdehyde dehydrogenase/glutarate-semialdehyde dehydrogenase